MLFFSNISHLHLFASSSLFSTHFSFDVTSNSTNNPEDRWLHGGNKAALFSGNSSDILHAGFGSHASVSGKDEAWRRHYRSDLSSDHTHDHAVPTKGSVLDHYLGIGYSYYVSGTEDPLTNLKDLVGNVNVVWNRRLWCTWLAGWCSKLRKPLKCGRRWCLVECSRRQG